MTTLALAQTLACLQAQCTVTQNEPKKKKNSSEKHKHTNNLQMI